MKSSNPNSTKNALERYQNLRLKEIISRPYLYASACTELSFILRNYCRIPKILQNEIFQDTLFAFSLLPEVQISAAISAANSLLHSAEFSLPKQKRALAMKEYKHAAVACKRKSKAHVEHQGLTALPQDVLVHIFGFLDLQSLVLVDAVCRLWKAAASDNHLWKILHATFFSNPCCCTKIFKTTTVGMESKKDKHSLDATGTGIEIDWRNTFKRAYIENCLKKFKSKWGYCLNCSSVIWLSSNKCSNESCKISTSKHHIKTLSTQQIVEYIMDGFLALGSFSDSDSDGDDTDEAFSFKLWAYAYPMRIND